MFISYIPGIGIIAMVGMTPGTIPGMDGMLLITVMAIIAGMTGDGVGTITLIGDGTIIQLGDMVGAIQDIIILIIIMVELSPIILQIRLIVMVDNVCQAIPAEVTEQGYLYHLEVIGALLPHVETSQLVREV